MSNWRNILSWQVEFPAVGDRIKLIGTESLWGSIGISYSVAGLDRGDIILGTVMDVKESGNWSSELYKGDKGCVFLELDKGMHFRIPQKSWQDFIEIIHE